MQADGNVTRQVLDEMRAGNIEAFDRFFERNTARVLVYINYSMGPKLRRKLEASDILQNLYLRLYRGFESFQRRANERGVLRTLIRMADHEITEAYRYYFKVEKRDAGREITAAYLGGEDASGLSPLAWTPSDHTSISQRVVRTEEYRRVMSMLSDLSHLEQYVTVARVVAGHSASTIAERLGKTRGAVQMLMARARDKLRERASRESHDHGD